MNVIFRIFLPAAIASACVFGQQNSGMAGAPASGSSRATKSVSGPAWTSGSMLFGTVMMDDGSPLQGGADIRVVCNGSERTVAHTYARGEFSFQWNSAAQRGPVAGPNNIMSTFGDANSDASAVFRGSIQGEPDYCDLRAEAPGFSSSEINLNNPSAFDSSNLGVIWLHRNASVHGNMVSLLTLEAPKGARKWFDKATSLARAGKLTAAIAGFRKAVAIYPKYAEAWLDLGSIQFRMGSKNDAQSSLQRALQLDAKMPGTWQVLGYMATDDKQWSDAARYLGHAVALDPLNSPLPWFYSALAYYHLRRYSEAEKSIRAEIGLDPQYRNRRAKYLLGLILIGRQNWKQGSEALRSYLASSPDPRDVVNAETVLGRVQAYAAK